MMVDYVLISQNIKMVCRFTLTTASNSHINVGLEVSHQQKLCKVTGYKIHFLVK